MTNSGPILGCLGRPDHTPIMLISRDFIIFSTTGGTDDKALALQWIYKISDGRF